VGLFSRSIFGGEESNTQIRIAWKLGPEFPDLVKGGAMGTVDGMVVHAAGMTYPWRENETGWWLDPAEPEWQPLPPLRTGRAYTIGASDQDSLFVVGGRRGWLPRRDAFRLVRAAQGWEWQNLPELRYPRGAPALALSGSRLYAIGGGSWGTGTFLADDVPGDEVLDLERLKDGWKEIPKCPGRRRSNCCAAALGSKVYVFGGVYAWKEREVQKVIRLDDAWLFDAESGDWMEIAPLPCNGLSGAAALPLDDRHIIIVGGAMPTSKNGGDAVLTYREDPKRGVRVGWYNENVIVYDARKDRYQTADGRLPMGTHDIRAAILERTVYTVGGENLDPSTSNTCSAVQVGALEVRP